MVYIVYMRGGRRGLTYRRMSSVFVRQPTDRLNQATATLPTTSIYVYNKNKYNNNMLKIIVK